MLQVSTFKLYLVMAITKITQLSRLIWMSFPNLGITTIEKDTWFHAVSELRDLPGDFKDLNKREIKRREHIHEIILTKKHQCYNLMLLACCRKYLPRE